MRSFHVFSINIVFFMFSVGIRWRFCVKKLKYFSLGLIFSVFHCVWCILFCIGSCCVDNYLTRRCSYWSFMHANYILIFCFSEFFFFDDSFSVLSLDLNSIYIKFYWLWMYFVSKLLAVAGVYSAIAIWTLLCVLSEYFVVIFRFV